MLIEEQEVGRCVCGGPRSFVDVGGLERQRG